MDRIRHPTVPSSQMLFTTVRLVVGPSEDIVGTGFFFHFGKEGDEPILSIITNHHVVSGADRVRFQMHEMLPGGGANLSSYWIDVDLGKNGCVVHPTEDLCAIPIRASSLRGGRGELPFVRYIDERYLATEEHYRRLFPLEAVTIVGYPFGVWDSVNNLPVFKGGMTATDPAVDYEGKPHGLVDIAVFPGCSGAPVMILNDSFWADANGLQGGPDGRLIVLGVLSHSMAETHQGIIAIREIECKLSEVSLVDVHVHLGRYIKARVVRELKQPVLDWYRSHI